MRVRFEHRDSTTTTTATHHPPPPNPPTPHSQDILDISNGDDSTLIIDGCEVRSQPYLIWKMLQQAMLVGAVVLYRYKLFDQSFAVMTVVAMVFYRFCLLNMLWLVYNGGDNVLYQSPTNCLAYYGTLNIAYESVNQVGAGVGAGVG